MAGQLLSWVLRDFAKPLLEKLPWVMRAGAGSALSDAWFGEQAVLRVSLGNALFFGGLSLALLGVANGHDPRVKCVQCAGAAAGPCLGCRERR